MFSSAVGVLFAVTKGGPRDASTPPNPRILWSWFEGIFISTDGLATAIDAVS
jgi:hypothetical protein